ncbi:hypothetical protein BGZ98_003630, partial [Dissophora globulifera]
TKAAATKSTAAPANSTANAKPTATNNKRKATAPAAKEAPAKKVAVTPAKKETKTAAAPAPKKTATPAPKKTTTAAAKKAAAASEETTPAAEKKKPTQKKVVEEKKVVEKKPAEKKVVAKKAAVEKKVVEKKTPAPKKTPQQPKETTKAAAASAPKQEQKDESDEEFDGEQQLMDDKTLLKDIDSSADEDSSDEENEEDRAAMKADTFAAMSDEISLNPKAAAALRKKLGTLPSPMDKAAKDVTGVVYLGRIPHGFYEDQMQAYFSQFGEVLRLRLSRNKKTGKSKHYAFIEFASQDVAEIVADTMDNYLLFGHQLKCKALQPSQIHPAMFLGANKRFKAIPWVKISKEKHNAEKTTGQMKQVKKKLLKNEEAKRAKLAELGIEYEFPGYKASVQEKPTHTKF